MAPDVPVFITRFGESYKNELAYFITQCIDDAPFNVTHEDGLSAMRVAIAGGEAICAREDARKV